MIMAVVEKASVERICKKTGFHFLCEVEDAKILVRLKDGQGGQ
jgi:hypothetical protein